MHPTDTLWFPRLDTGVISCGIALLAGCADSVIVDAPRKNASVADPVTITVEFHPRAVRTSFKAYMDGAAISSFPSSGSPVSTSLPLTPGSHTLRVEADMSPLQAFDSTGQDWPFSVLPGPPPPPPPPVPGFRVSSPPQRASVVWGQTATYNLMLSGTNGFSGTVTLQGNNLPFGVAIAPVAATLTAATPVQTVSLNATTQAAATRPGPSQLALQATAMNTVSRSTAMLNVQRKPGAFMPLPSFTTASSACNGAVSAEVGPAFPAGVGVTFHAPTGSPNTRAAFAQGYAFSTDCRVGVVSNAVVNNTISLSLFNLGFDARTGANALGAPINVLITYQAIYLSPDSSLAVILEPGGAILQDLITGRQCNFGSNLNLTQPSIQLSGDVVTINDPAVPNVASCSVR